MLEEIATEHFDHWIVDVHRVNIGAPNRYQISHIDRAFVMNQLIRGADVMCLSMDKISAFVHNIAGINPQARAIVSYIARHEVADCQRRIAMAETQLFVLENSIDQSYVEVTTK